VAVRRREQLNINKLFWKIKKPVRSMKRRSGAEFLNFVCMIKRLLILLLIGVYKDLLSCLRSYALMVPCVVKLPP